MHLDKNSTAGNIPGRMISHCVCNSTKHACHLLCVLKEKKSRPSLSIYHKSMSRQATVWPHAFNTTFTINSSQSFYSAIFHCTLVQKQLFSSYSFSRFFFLAATPEVKTQQCVCVWWSPAQENSGYSLISELPATENHQ